MPKRPSGPIARRSVELVGRCGGLRAVWWYHGPRRPPGPIRWQRWDGVAWVDFLIVPGVADMPKALVVGEGGLAVTSPRESSKVLAKFPTLGGWLADRVYDDGRPCGVVQLQIRTNPSGYEGNLKVADHGGLMLRAAGRNVDELLAALEAALSSNPVPFEVDPYPLNASKGRRK